MLLDVPDETETARKVGADLQRAQHASRLGKTLNGTEVEASAGAQEVGSRHTISHGLRS